MASAPFTHKRDQSKQAGMEITAQCRLKYSVHMPAGLELHSIKCSFSSVFLDVLASAEKRTHSFAHEALQDEERKREKFTSILVFSERRVSDTFEN